MLLPLNTVLMMTDPWKLILGDCIKSMSSMDECSVDAVVCDPPYELGFMGRAWDSTGIAFSPATWAACLRVLKPGGHLLAFGGSRTYHRIACAIEDSGFEIRDCLQWIYGSGFPKSLDVSKAIDKANGDEREIIATSTRKSGSSTYDKRPSRPRGLYASDEYAISAAASAASAAWTGWGTALKPAYEPIIMARKPLDGTVASNVLKWGTGAINIDGCRIETSDNLNGGAYAKNPTPRAAQDMWTRERKGDTNCMKRGGAGDYRQPEGRFPSNVILDEEAGRLLDEQSGTLTSGANPTRRGSPKFRNAYGTFEGQAECEAARGIDIGGASRFFYTAKTSTDEREAGLRFHPRKTAGECTDREDGSDGLNSPRAGAGRTSNGRANIHPTVKPIDLMSWLCRLVTPPNGLILDPFCGSGTTGCAAMMEDFRFIGCELSEEYAEIARARIAYWHARRRSEMKQTELL